MSNKLLRKIYYLILPFSIQAYISKLIFKPKFGADMIFSKGKKFYYGDVSFGNGCRIAADSIFTNITVGHYTIFAQNFRMLAFVHDYNAFAVNSEIEQILGRQIQEESMQPQIIYYPQTVIGSDVWIGEFVTVKGGIHIGDGAVIGAGSIVTHDVPAFSIVAGVPARFVKWRFDERKKLLMQDLKWWEWDKKKIANNYVKLCNFDESLRDEIKN